MGGPRGKLACSILLFIFLVSCSRTPSNVTEITWAVGKDSTGTQQKLVAAFMRQHPGIRVTTIEMPESASTQRDSYVTYFISEDPSIDVYAIDITWPAEFAAARWIIPLDAYFPPATQKDFLPGPIEGCSYRGHSYAVPWFTDAGLLFYRADLLKGSGNAPPRTWSELVRTAQAVQERRRVYGFVYQAAQYEGLICNYLEYVWSFGGTVMDAAGRVRVDTPQAREALAFFGNLIRTYRVAPSDVLTFKEEESRQAFTSGESLFLRNWPYVWKIAQDTSTSKVEGRIGISALPGREPGTGVSCLGGWNLAISRFSRHPDAAWQLIEFMTDAAAQKTFALNAGRLPSRHALYRDPDILAAAPHYTALYPAFTRARPRPVSPVYSKISDILQIELHRYLTGQQDAATALARAQRQIDEVQREVYR